MRSSEDVTLSSSSEVSSMRLLFWEYSSFRKPLVVTHSRALLPGFGCQGPEAWLMEFSNLYSDWVQTAGPWVA